MYLNYICMYMYIAQDICCLILTKLKLPPYYMT